MNPRHLFYTAVLLFAGTHNGTLLAQEMPKVIPPSPEVGTILQHSPINVSLYTGTPNISVPFHTISHGGVEVPVSLSYSTDGVRVDNIASWAGLGWSLNAGGLISRTINKLPDDSSLGYMNTTYTMADFLSRDSNQPSSAGGWGNFGGPEDQPWQLSTVYGDGEYRDYEPDIFNFSFLGYSGQFYYNQGEGTFNQAPLSNLRIETIKASGIISGFIITDEAGVKYYFGLSKDQNRNARELLKDTRTKTITYDGVSQSGPIPFPLDALNCYQSWMLMDIVFPTSTQMIQFNYTTEQNVETYVLTEQQYSKEYTGCQEQNTNYLLRIFNQPKLESIVFPSGKILFEKDLTERLDLKNSFALKSMTLLDKKDIQIRKMKLNTTYWESTQGNTTTVLFDMTEINRGKYRLRLDSVSLFGQNSTTEEQKYVFNYNPQNLPNRYSKATDYFGYYNGSNTNTSFLPKTFIPALSSYIGTANRSIDPAFTDAAVLEKITYPTGGYDEFEWENNSISFFGGNGHSYRDYLVPDDLYFNSDLSMYGDPDPTIDFSTILIVPADIRGRVDFTVTMSGCIAPFNQTDCDFNIKIVGINGTSYLLNIYEPSFSLDLPPGDYKLIANSKEPYVPPGQTGGSSFTFSVYAKWYLDPSPGELLYGGLRIKEVRTFDAIGSPAFSKSYDYRHFDPSTPLSSGSTINIVDVLNLQYLMTCDGENNVDAAYKLSSSSQAPQIHTKGGLVGYRNVTEKFNNGLQGYNQYTYSFVEQYLDPVVGPAPYYANNLIPVNQQNPVYCDWLRGNLEKVETFGQQTTRLSSKVYEYETADQKPIQYSGIQVLFFPGALGISWNSSVTEHHRLISTTETNFLGGNEVTVLKEYSYNTLSQLSQERSFDNNQLDATTKYFYPSDDSMSAKPCAAQLIAQNRIGAPLVTQSFEVTEKLSEQETLYKDWGSSLIAPEIIQTAKGTATAEPRIRYTVMDTATGNPREVQQENGTRICYIWGYNGSQPVAKIENMAYASIPGNLITAIESASNYVPNVTYSEANLLTALTNLRADAALANAMVTTYTYKPLVGISTITDPKGEKVTYHYDNFNRLQFVKDRDGNILSENQYHYRTQN